MVREYQQVRDRDLVILLDLWLPANPTEADRERVELAVSFVATACVERMRSARESVVSITALGRTKQVWRGQAGGVAFDSLLELLALIEPGQAENPAEGLQDADFEATPTARRAIITTRKDRDDVVPPEEMRTTPWEFYRADWDEMHRFFSIDEIEAGRRLES